MKQCFLFWKPTVARRITFYFILFGLLIFYLTSVGHLVAAKKHLAATATRIVRTEIDRIQGSRPARLLEGDRGPPPAPAARIGRTTTW
jgi:hypothetical protein